MFKTIKSKIVFITLTMLIIYSMVASVIAINVYVKGKTLKIKSCNLQVEYFAQQFNKSIVQLQINAMDLALMGSEFFTAKHADKENLTKTVINNFKNNKLAIGGGVWYEPYLINKNQKRFCVYAFTKDKGSVISDKSFESEGYNYFNQSWYHSIKNSPNKYNQPSWTKPYFDGTGTYSLMTTVGSRIYDEKENFVGMATVDWKLDEIINQISEIKPTKNSFALFADTKNDFILADTDISAEKKDIGKSLKDVSWYNPNSKNEYEFTYNSIKYISFIKTLDNNMLLIVNVPKEELFETLMTSLNTMLTFLFFTSCLIAVVLYIMLKNNINAPIQYMINQASQIGSGDLDKKIQISEPKEFVILAESFNKMTQDVKDYITNLNLITAEKEKMDSELAIAKSIQKSALPNVFPPYPERNEFDIFASMDTAKQVGGDFYDFFFIDSDHFMFLIADVSGKGIPAALFMMTTKTLIKNLAKSGLPLDVLMTEVNRKICKTNEQGLFVTVFMCSIELSTGKMSCVNAGHNPPLLKKATGNFEYFRPKPNLVVGALDNTVYNSYEMELKPNDCIFLYTDGITEASNKEKSMFGEGRLIEKINAINDSKTEINNVLFEVKSEIDEFANGEEQSDDITMLIFKYNGTKVENMAKPFDKNEIKKFLLPANVERLETIISWIEKVCDEANVPQKSKIKLNLAVEEIFVNISTYAYPPKSGDVEVTFMINQNEVTIQFIDSGTQYNPLEKPDPDITLNAEDRPIGGLGIYMVKQSMDKMHYEYKDGKNILTLKMLF